MEMKAFQESLLSRSSSDKPFEIANAVLLKDSVGPVKKGFEHALQEFYHGNVFPMDKDVAKQVNDWVAKATHEKITTLLEDNPGGIEAVILNAIYFKGAWKSKFDKRDTELAAFHPDPKREPIRVQMMTQTLGATHYDHPLFDAVDLPYAAVDDEPGLVATLLLPKDGHQLAEAASASFREYEKWTSTGTRNTQVHVTVPKFKIESSSELSEALKAAGIQRAFGAGADFSGISKHSDGLFISQVMHKATVEVNEEGTEAAAATAVMMMRSMRKPIPIPLTFDRPFLFMIRDEPSGVVLFLVQIVDPSTLG
eukprot:TRINITY_DN3405_c0_g2_i5.p1 TRINITY_DN3405_c0_g2~~TRINITY_DN3405_c0_g2_i5.p1  ORF type:complete len:310 (-),score=72.13 TRINITY_DN3405_c0_g2_i5:177-1106(-)